MALINVAINFVYEYFSFVIYFSKTFFRNFFSNLFFPKFFSSRLVSKTFYRNFFSTIFFQFFFSKLEKKIFRNFFPKIFFSKFFSNLFQNFFPIFFKIFFQLFSKICFLRLYSRCSLVYRDKTDFMYLCYEKYDIQANIAFRLHHTKFSILRLILRLW